jgi:hypothetical protein
MGTLLFILLASVAIVLIAWAIDIPTTKWEGFKPTPRKRLLDILERIRIQDEEEDPDEAQPPATTYTEAVKRMQRREKARTG